MTFKHFLFLVIIVGIFGLLPATINTQEPTSCTLALISEGQPTTLKEFVVTNFSKISKKTPTIAAGTPVFVISNLCTEKPMWDIMLTRIMKEGKVDCYDKKNDKVNLYSTKGKYQTFFWPKKTLVSGYYILCVGSEDENHIYIFKH